MWGFTVLLGVLCLTGISQAQQCDHVYSEMFHCLDDGALEITCPSLHWILIKDTAYYISDGTTCPPNATNTTDTHCLAPGKVPEVRAGCHQHEHCDDVTIPQRTTSTCTGSTHYVWIQYQCEPLHNVGGKARAVDLCNARDPFIGTFVHVDSHPTALFGSKIYERENCMCVVTVPAGNDVFFRLPFMLKDGQTNGACAQNISVWDEIGNYTFCESGNGANLTCSDRERNFRIQYETDDTSIGVIFLLQVFVPYTSSGLALSCGIHPADGLPEITSTAATPEVTTQDHDGTTGPTSIPDVITTQAEGSVESTDTESPSDVYVESIGGVYESQENESSSDTTTTVGFQATEDITFPQDTTTTVGSPATEGDSTGGDGSNGGDGNGGSGGDGSGGESGSSTGGSDTFAGLDQQWKLPIIVGMVALAVLIMIIVVLVVCIRTRREREPKDEVRDDASDRTSHYQFVTDIYIDGDQKSKLVLDKKNPVMQI